MANNPLSDLRFRNIIRPGKIGPETFHPSFGMNDDMEEDQPFMPEHSAIDRYNQALSSQPQRNKPGLLRTILSGAIGGFTGQGQEGIERMLYSPYYHQMEDFNAKLGPLERSANFERQNNQIGRQFTHDTAENKRKIDADNAIERYRTEQMKLRQDDMDRREREANARESRLIEQFNQGAINRKELEDKIQEGRVELEKLRAENAKLLEGQRQGGRVELEGVRQEGQQTLEGTRQEGRMNLEGKRQEGRAESINLREALSGTGKEETASNQQTRFRTNAERLIREDPNGLGRFIVIDVNSPKGFTIKQAKPGTTEPLFGTTWGKKEGPTPEELKKINDYINNTGAKGTSTTNTKTSTIKVPTAPKGWKYVPKMDASGNQIGWTPIEDKGVK